MPMHEQVGKDTRKPEIRLCPWRDDLLTNEEPFPEPTRSHPLIYHLFGRLDRPDSLVLTEDEYFTYLKGVTQNRSNIPPVVRNALTDTSLIFLGFRLDDWSFRVLFRSLVNEQVQNRRRRHIHAAVQLELDETDVHQPARAQRYLIRYFGEARIEIFWGRPEEFLTRLAEAYARWVSP